MMRSTVAELLPNPPKPGDTIYAVFFHGDHPSVMSIGSHKLTDVKAGEQSMTLTFDDTTFLSVSGITELSWEPRHAS